MDARSIFALILIAFSVFGIVGQPIASWDAWRRLRADENAGGYSVVPLFFGIIGAIGLSIHPSGDVSRFWWIPLILDPGCWISAMVVYLIWKCAFGRRKPPK